MNDLIMKDILDKYNQTYGDILDECERGMVFAAVQIIEKLENYKTKIMIDGNTEFWYIDPSVIKDIKEEFCL